MPDGCSDVIWQEGRGAFVGRPRHAGPSPSDLPAGTVLVGLCFRPGVGGAALGLPLAEVRDQRVDLADLGREVVAPDLDPEQVSGALTDLAGQWLTDAEPDPVVQATVMALHDPAARVGDLVDDLGVSERQLRRRHHAVGLRAQDLAQGAALPSLPRPALRWRDREPRRAGRRDRLRRPGPPHPGVPGAGRDDPRSARSLERVTRSCPR